MATAATARVLEKEEWVPLDEARLILGKGDKSIERYDKAGHLRSKLETREGRKAERLYHRGDLDRIVAEAIPASATPPQNALVSKSMPVKAELSISTDSVMSIHDAIREVTSAVRLSEKLWLTIGEATAYSGIGERTLWRAIKDGTLRAQKAGFHGGWIIQRSSLEALEL